MSDKSCRRGAAEEWRISGKFLKCIFIFKDNWIYDSFYSFLKLWSCNKWIKIWLFILQIDLTNIITQEPIEHQVYTRCVFMSHKNVHFCKCKKFLWFWKLFSTPRVAKIQLGSLYALKCHKLTILLPTEDKFGR